MQKDVGKVYKHLVSQAAALHILMGDVKASVSLSALPIQLLAAAVRSAIVQQLTKLGWAEIGGNMLLHIQKGLAAPGQLMDYSCITGLEVVVRRNKSSFLIFKAGGQSNNFSPRCDGLVRPHVYLRCQWHDRKLQANEQNIRNYFQNACKRRYFKPKLVLSLQASRFFP